MSDPAMQLPPGFRFHPTDEELILHYLRNQATESPCPVAIIADVDIYKFDPWALPSKAIYGDREWYFFTPRDRKYPNGVRPNRAAGSGYWKSTGTDKPVRSSATGESVGVKKALVFYKGRPPKGIKTNWIMHEYRLATTEANTYRPIKFRSASMTMTMRLDEWVLCRICCRKTSQVSVPPLSDHELDEPCGAYPMSMSSAGMIMEGGAGAAGAPRMPSISELPSECLLAQLFNDNGLSGHAEMARHEYDQHAALLGHPIMNQFDVNSSGNNISQLSQMDSSSVGTGKRKRLLEEDGGHNGWTSQPADKKPNGSCFGATMFPNRQQRLTGVTRPGSSDVAPFLIWPHGDWMNWW